MTHEKEPKSGPVTRRFAGYDLVAKVASHHGSTTFRAIQVALHRPVLVTVLPPDAGRVKVQRESFHRRQTLLSRMRHENVLSAIDAGTFKGCRFFVTEHVDGRSLADELAEGVQVDAARAVTVARDVARALAYLGAEKILHRNISPANVLVTDAGVVKLVGFAHAKDHRPGGHETWIDHDVEATLYLAPEVIQGERGLDARADIYSLGCVLYHMLTGHVPFRSRSAAAVLESHAAHVPTDPRDFRNDLPPSLVEVLDRTLRKRREHRYRSADDLAKDLEAVRLGQPVSKFPADGALWPPPPERKLLPRIPRLR